MNGHMHKNPQYAMLSKRLESFKEWPKHLSLDSNNLAEAGFVYTSLDGLVTCFHCGISIKNWGEGDDPSVKHIRLFPFCCHILMVKEQDFVIQVILGNIPVDNNESQKNAIESCIDNNICPKLVRTAVTQFILRHGHYNFNGEDIATLALKIQEEKRTPPSTSTLNCCPRTADAQEEEEEHDAVGDKVMCFCKNMKQGDSWEEQAENILLVNGRRIVDSDQKEIDAVKSCLIMGIDPDLVRKAVEVFISRYGLSNYAASDIATIAMEIRGGETTPRTTSSACCPEQPEEQNEDEQEGTSNRVRCCCCETSIRKRILHNLLMKGQTVVDEVIQQLNLGENNQASADIVTSQNLRVLQGLPARNHLLG